MRTATPTISINIDVSNPGQFFACCGLLELADRLWPGAEGWFDSELFYIVSDGTLEKLLQELARTDLTQLDTSNDMSSPMRLSEPFDLTLDWWTDELSGGKQLKVWAGSMRGVRIARAMQAAIRQLNTPHSLFEYAVVVFDPDHPTKKVEPYYFDSRRGSNAQPLDIGFSPDALKMQALACPAVEILCLIGLQRFRPAPTERPRVFDYYVWPEPLPPQIASVACRGILRTSGSQGYRFENGFRTDQRKHKSFLPATRIGG